MNGKRYRRKKGPVPDVQLQPLRGVVLGVDITTGLFSQNAISREVS
jgi:hypothetical protein